MLEFREVRGVVGGVEPPVNLELAVLPRLAVRALVQGIHQREDGGVVHADGGADEVAERHGGSFEGGLVAPSRGIRGVFRLGRVDRAEIGIEQAGAEAEVGLRARGHVPGVEVAVLILIHALRGHDGGVSPGGRGRPVRPIPQALERARAAPRSRGFAGRGARRRGLGLGEDRSRRSGQEPECRHPGEQSSGPTRGPDKNHLASLGHVRSFATRSSWHGILDARGAPHQQQLSARHATRIRTVTIAPNRAN